MNKSALVLQLCFIKWLYHTNHLLAEKITPWMKKIVNNTCIVFCECYFQGFSKNKEA